MTDVGFSTWGRARRAEVYLQADPARGSGDQARHEGQGASSARGDLDQIVSQYCSTYRNAMGDRINNQGNRGSTDRRGPVVAAFERLWAGATKQDRALRRSLMFCLVVAVFAALAS